MTMVHFKSPVVPPGDYVSAVDNGKLLSRSARQSRWPPDEVRNIDVVMASSSAKLSSNVEVSAGIFDAEPEPAAAGFTLEGEERKNLASVLADDPLRAVQSLPGVTSNNDFSSEFSIRGAPFHRIGLYLDGVLLHSPFHTTDGQADNGSLTIFNGDLTDDMTLYQGAWPVRFADRTAGVLDVQTRQGTRDGIHGQVKRQRVECRIYAGRSVLQNEARGVARGLPKELPSIHSQPH